MRLSGNIPDSKAVIIRNTGLLSSGVSRADQVSQVEDNDSTIMKVFTVLQEVWEIVDRC